MFFKAQGTIKHNSLLGLKCKMKKKCVFSFLSFFLSCFCEAHYI